ncbi:hypothetical protein [Corynebacterium hindlerae]|uniref:hypothetical protein n=1 Tax=Corynebacterium hindlerae TaxID=699041 RepID=UPI003AAA3015
MVAPTILVDGRSGSGKTTYATELGCKLGWRVVHMDDFYPGWWGLAAGAQMVARDVLRLDQPGFRRWNWELSEPGQWVPLDPGEPLIVEGVGAVTAASVAAARLRGPALSVRIDCAAHIRKRRALSRDPEFEEWWDMWAVQEEEFLSHSVPVDLTISADC